MKVLNLYAGIGGNRKLWKNVQVTAIENNPQIAKVYQDFFPQDRVIVTDAHQYLLDHYKEFEFIWSSPPCPTHSKMQLTSVFGQNSFNKNRKAVYPDMHLYQEILLLKHFFKGKFAIENVQGYYKPLIPAQKVGRHYIWCNFVVDDFKTSSLGIRKNIKFQEEKLGVDLSEYSFKKPFTKIKVLRNCVNPKLGLHIFNCAFKQRQKTLNEG